MFTGVVEELGRVEGVRRGARSLELEINAPSVAGDLSVGDSVSVSGVCLTVTRRQQNVFFADVMPETLEHTSLGQLRPGDPVNLERSMASGGRFGGHLVLGHVDALGRITAVHREDNAVRLRISAPAVVMRYVVAKGSVAVDGVSLTVAGLGDGWVEVAVIPHTLAVTTFRRRRVGDAVNLEADILGKYVERILEARLESAPAGSQPAPGLTAGFLREQGF
ncbi:MAG: riboflavin synthase [Firmicutes bacterium]|nr:riboflavin synthase [Bacillota bacterium]